MVSGHAGWDDFSCGQQCVVVFAHPDLVSAVPDADGEAVRRPFQKKSEEEYRSYTEEWNL